TEVSAEGLVRESVIFDPGETDAAFEELDARYLAGEAAPCARVWSAVMGAHAAVNRHELPTTAKNWVNVDHRRVTGYAPGDVVPHLRSVWDVTPNISIRIEAVHRLSGFGAVATHTVEATSSEGFEAEWREITVSTVEGDLLSRSELFDEADLDAAL